MLNISQIKTYNTNFKSNISCYQGYKNKKQNSLQSGENSAKNVSFKQKFLPQKQCKINNSQKLKTQNELESLKDIGATICMMLGAAIVTMGAIGLGFAMLFLIDTIFKSNSNNEKLLPLTKQVERKDVENISLQIDSLNNLYKNKSITLDELVKGVNEIKKNNKQN